MTITYFLDILSSWCWLAEDAHVRLRTNYGDRLALDWCLTPIRDGAPLETTREQEAWYYRRTAFVTGVQLNPDWLEGPETATLVANAATEAARALGVRDDRVRLALARAALVDGRPVTRRDVAIEIAAAAGGVDPHELAATMDAPETRARLHDGFRRFTALGVDQRPTFLCESAIGDRALLSGIYRYEPLAACVDAMLHDEERYAGFAASHPPFPT